MGGSCSNQDNKFYFIDRQDVQQSNVRPTSLVTSLQQKDTEQSFQGPVQGSEGQYTGLIQFQLPQKYRKRIKQNPLNCDKAIIRGKQIFDPFMFKKSLNVYYGQWKKGKPHGYGKIFNPDKDYYYEGYFQAGLPSSYGVFMTQEIQYRGQIKYGRAQGKGIYIQGETIIEGNFQSNYPHQNCVQKSQNYFFQGDYENGRWKKGRLLFNYQTCQYQGEFKNGFIHGQGILKTPEYIYSGNFIQGQKEGKGKIQWKSGQCYQGHFSHDQIVGLGQFYYQNKLYYKGNFQKGKAQGQGMIIQDKKGAIWADWKYGQSQRLA